MTDQTVYRDLEGLELVSSQLGISAELAKLALLP